MLYERYDTNSGLPIVIALVSITVTLHLHNVKCCSTDRKKSNNEIHGMGHACVVTSISAPSAPSTISAPSTTSAPISTTTPISTTSPITTTAPLPLLPGTWTSLAVEQAILQFFMLVSNPVPVKISDIILHASEELQKCRLLQDFIQASWVVPVRLM